ncbi:zinc finger protein 578 [Drosophila grimshawi]|uniref:zinc finger protein 578 n=1 Tax=Drosophila grimshawi TaxID=7222 RepID=UPI000C870C2C|nr:zinc finger protein 578 [Drosophila grimshawi]
MEICANLLTNTNYTEFHLKCIYCSVESDLKDWEQFVLHTRNEHLLDDADEGSAQSENEILYARDEHFEAYGDTNNSVSDMKEENDQFPADDLRIEESNEFIMDNFVLQSPNGTLVLASPSYNGMYTISETVEQDISGDESENWATGQATTISKDHYPSDDAEYNDDEQWVSSTDSDDEQGVSQPKRSRSNSTIMRKLRVSFTRHNPRVLHFIEEFKNQPCLWNPNDSKFGDKKFETEAYNSIIEGMGERADVIFTEKELKKSIQQLLSQFNLASQRDDYKPLTGMPASYFRKCKFLSIAPAHSQSDSDDADESVHSDVIQLNFKEINKMTTTFIETFENFPVLYDSSVAEFKSLEARTQAYIKIAQMLAPKMRVNETEVHLAVMRLRKWAYMTLRRVKSKELRRACSKSELHYIQQCSFLPPKSESFVIKCELCDKRFFIDYTLRTHMVKVHNVGELPYLCSQCPRRFGIHHDMERHNLRQHCEKLLKCGYCDSTFSLKNDLNLHTRIHTGEKPYVCELCGKSFRLKLLLDYHINGFHLNLRPFACDLCPNTYRRRVQLKNHMKAHFNIKDKKCNECGAAFTCPTSLSRHRKAFHNTPKPKTQTSIL